MGESGKVVLDLAEGLELVSQKVSRQLAASNT